MNVKMGTLKWRWTDDDGMVHKFVIPNSFYVPQGKVRLLSPQHWAQTQRDKPSGGTGSSTTDSAVTLHWQQKRYSLTVPLGKNDNVATFHLAPGYKHFKVFCTQAGTTASDDDDDPILADSTLISDDEDDNDEVLEVPTPWKLLWRRPKSTRSVAPEPSDPEGAAPTKAEFDLDGPAPRHEQPNIIVDEEDRQPTNHSAQLLRYHHKYAHLPFRKLQEMAKQGIIPKQFAKCPVPVCTACMYAKATKKQWRDKTRKSDAEPVRPTRPGQIVSVDQLVSPTPGLIAQMTGFLTSKRYCYATVYVDQYSRLGYVYLQKTASADETLEGKQAFEKFARDRGVTVEAYHADNGIFKANKWVMACRAAHQTLTFAGVNAHHQNGVAERRIRELQELARTMLIHATRRWPNAITANLWPYALRMANDVLNDAPSFQLTSRDSPHQAFSRTQVASNPKHHMPFGCPVYVLDNDLQGNKPFHKWKERARVGIYLGRSPQHSRNVALVLDRTTSLVSPQFHVKFDPCFHTTQQDKFDSQWQTKAGFVAKKGEKREEQSKLMPTNPTLLPQQEAEGAGMPEPEGAKPTSSTSKSKRKRERTPPKDRREPESQRPRQRKSRSEPAAAVNEELLTPTRAEPPTTVESDQRKTRSGRKSQPVQRLIEAMMTEMSAQTADDIEGEIFCLQALYPTTEEDCMLQENSGDPLQAFKATSDPDTMYLHQAMKQPDREEFLKAMIKVVTDQKDNGNFTIIHKSKVPEGASILPAVWQMKRKREISTGRVKKWKARLNIDGSRMQHGVHYDQTYAPVASWNSIRMLLTMTAVHGWHTKQLDYVSAFPQAPVEKPMYMRIPRGFEIDKGDTRDYVLAIERNIYGSPSAGRVFNKYLVDKLVNQLKFTQSKIDECVFYRGKTVYVLYTDDSILAGPDPKEIDQIIMDLQRAKLDITVEGDLQDFLGVKIARQSDGTIHLTQPHLIGQILDDLRMNDPNVKSKSTPAASSKLLTRHSESPSFDHSFDYKSIIGKLLYLEKASRPDIAYAVHKCAQYASDPRKEHGEAVRWLGRYLKGTRDKGTILRPVKGKDLEVYVDADFAGNWNAKEAALNDRDTARSRHGYIITYAGCPIIWKSQMQTEIALSSTESEYTGLSYALRDAIPLMEILKEMKRRKFPVHTAQARVHCRVFEDNSGALEMAKVHKFRPRTKHINVKLHHFRDYVARNEISIHAIGTNAQAADFLTKPVNEEILVRHRATVMGW